MRRLDDGRYESTPKSDRPALVLTAEAPMKRLAALLPPSRRHLTTFHGVCGPNSKLRPVVVRTPALDAPTTVASSAPPAPPKPKRLRLDRAALHPRTFGDEVWRCSRDGRRRVLAVVSSHRPAQEVLQRLGLVLSRKALPLSDGPAPPQLALGCDATRRAAGLR